MGDSFVTIIAIFLAAMLMFVFPLMSVSEKSDNISQLTVQTATTDFVDKVRTTGELTLDDYDKYIQTITSTGNAFDVELMVQIMDENIGVKTTQAETTKIGENIYYNLYTSQLESVLKDNKKHKITLKEGDRVSVTVKNTNTTIAQTLRNFFYRIAGNDTYQIAVQYAGIVTVNGKN
ncbi:MAG: hypothetical protein Q4C11_00715 [Clostridium sp.]|jgi:predicted DNA-binding antitoxin AbrB/MazE fold protein|nr:hypothetical protein [Clostridium sp.]CCZ17612.1 putative uncharacterized protein [Clostridium sp. CAG:780]